MNNATKAIVFDVGNVLMYDFPMESRFLYNIYLEAKEKVQYITFPQFLQFNKNYNMAYNKWIYEYGKNLFQDKWTYINQKAWCDVVSRWEDYCILIPGAVEELKQHKKDYLYAVCANQSKKTIDFFKSKGLLSLFDPFVIDELFGYSKPDSRIFMSVLQHLKCEPNECLMVGDKYVVDILPATSIGLQTALMINNFSEMECCVRYQWEQDYLEYCKSFDEESGQSDFVVGSIHDMFIALERK